MKMERIRWWQALLGGGILGVLIGYYFGPDGVTAIATFFLAFFGWYALGQIKIMQSDSERNAKKDINLALASQVGFFRKEVLELAEKAGDQTSRIREQLNYEVPAIEKIQEFSVQWLLKHKTRETLLQQLFWSAAQKIDGKNRYYRPTHRLLNSMEELALNIRATGTQGESNLISIRRGFIAYVEAFAWLMVLTNPYHSDMYPGIRWLYAQWVDLVPRTPPEELKEQIEKDIKAASERMHSVMPAEEYRKYRDLIDSLKSLKEVEHDQSKE